MTWHDSCSEHINNLSFNHRSGEKTNSSPWKPWRIETDGLPNWIAWWIFPWRSGNVISPDGIDICRIMYRYEIPPSYPIGSMYAIYGNMDPINIPPMLAYIPAPWILWVSLDLPFMIPFMTQLASRPFKVAQAKVDRQPCAGEGGGLRMAPGCVWRGLIYVDPKVGSAYCCCEFKAGLDPLLLEKVYEKVRFQMVSVSAGWKSLVARHGHFPLPK